jgi:hypothetical protein
VLTDTDDDTEINEIINTFIQSQKNAYTKEIVFLHKNLVEVLGIPQCERYRKPLNIMYHYSKKKISDDKLKKLKEDYISKLLPSGEE